MKHKHIFLKGLPASGKSTFCEKLLRSYPDVYVRVNKDDLRKAFYQNNFTKKNEKFLLSLEETMISKAVCSGKFVLWDNTHLSPKHEERKKSLEKSLSISFEEKFFDISVSESIERDSKREKPVGEAVIKKMAKMLPRKYPQYEWGTTKERAYIFDMDGTLSFNTSGRSWYDPLAVVNDSVNEPVAKLCRLLGKNHTIIIVSARSFDSYGATTLWLKNNDIRFDHIFFRPSGDNRKDEVVKQEIYENHIKDRFEILGVFDDRFSVCKFWNSVPLPLFRVGDPEFYI